MSKTVRVVLLVASLAILISLAYGGSIGNGFVWDDETLVLDNGSVRDLSSWPTYFTDRSTISAEDVLSRMYRPLQTLSYAVDWWVWNGDPGGFHFTSLVLHLLVCVAMVPAFGPVVGRRVAFIAALLFAVHPAISESVLGLASRGNQLYTLFGLVSVACAVRSRSVLDRAQLAALAAFGMSLLSKEPAIAFIGLVPLLRRVPSRDDTIDWKREAGWWSPFPVVAVIYLVVRYAVAGSMAVTPYWGGSLWATVQMQAKVFAVYWKLILWPFDLQARYFIEAPGPFPDWRVLSAFVLCAALVMYAAVSLLRTGRARLIAAAIVWFFLSLAPVANLVPVPGSMMAERFLYGTLVGVLPLLLGAVGNLDVGNNFRWAVFGTLVLAVPLVLVDRARTNVWRDNASFFEKLALQLPDDPSAQISQAAEELKRGETESALARLQRLPDRRVALLVPRDRALLRYWHGRALLAAGKAAEAAAELQRAERFLPEDQVALDLSEALARSGHLRAAEARLRQYLKAAPGDDAAWNGLGNVQWMAGDLPGAASSYREALRLNPENKEAGINLARLEGEGSP